MSLKINLINQKFGRLTVIDYTQSKNSRSMWKCKCDCNNELIVSGAHLRSGHTQSCGCLQKENAKNSSLNNIWGRKYKNSWKASAKNVWLRYSDGCSFETFLKLSKEPCYYCGIVLSNTFNKYINKEGFLTNEKVSKDWAEQAYFKYNGLDRIDSTKNHNEDNIVSCCFICNRAKGNLTMQEFNNWLKRIIIIFKEK